MEYGRIKIFLSRGSWPKSYLGHLESLRFSAVLIVQPMHAEEDSSGSK